MPRRKNELKQKKRRNQEGGMITCPGKAKVPALLPGAVPMLPCALLPSIARVLLIQD